MSPGKLIIVRHGESEWNATGQWTGLTDVNLTPKGHRDAALMGEQLQDMPLHYAFTSDLNRTVQTLQSLLKTQKQTDLPFERRQAMNERDYGKYTGLNKWEVKEAVDPETFHGIRRGWDYPIEGGETLQDVYNRTVPFYLEELLPRLNQGQNVLLSGHGNSNRSLMKYIENIPDHQIGEVEFVFGTILLYDVDHKGLLANKERRTIQSELPPA